MPIMKFTASADTTIVNAYFPNTLTRAHYANIGAADSLEIFSIYNSGSETQKARALVQFPINEISQSRTVGNIPASGSVNFIFKLYNVQHPETLPKNYYVLINPISSSWDEGHGLDLENYSDTGRTGSKGFGSNWFYRTTELWNNVGGDYISGSYSKQFYFNEGTEDIELDVTNIIEAQISGVLPPYGVAISLSGNYENGVNATTYYTKRFSARSSEYFYKVPALEARWKSVTNDDRGDFYFTSNNLSNSDNLQNIYLFNRVNGTLKDIPNSPTVNVKILNVSGTLLTSSIGTTKVSTGVYKASFSITGSEDTTLTDIWFSGSLGFYTGSIEAKVRYFEDSAVLQEYVLSLTNLKNIYKQNEKPNIRIYGRPKDWSPNVYSVANKNIETLTFKNLYYKVFRIVDDYVVIDYGISPIEYTLCSYDKNGNYFNLDMNMFEKGYAYGIKLMLKNEDSKTEFPTVYRFKVE